MVPELRRLSRPTTAERHRTNTDSEAESADWVHIRFSEVHGRRNACNES